MQEYGLTIVRPTLQELMRESNRGQPSGATKQDDSTGKKSPTLMTKEEKRRATYEKKLLIRDKADAYCR